MMGLDRKLRRQQTMGVYSGEVTRQVVDAMGGKPAGNRRAKRAQAATLRRIGWKHRDAKPDPSKPAALPTPPAPAFPSVPRSSAEVMARALDVGRFAPPVKGDGLIDFTPKDLQSCVLRAIAAVKFERPVDVNDAHARTQAGERLRVAAEDAVLRYITEHEDEGLFDIGWVVHVAWEAGVQPGVPDEKPALVFYAVDRDRKSHTLAELEAAMWKAAGREVPK